jgi:hypothetical protein
LVLDLEQEGTVNLDHVRTTPKRTIGLGSIELLGKNNNKNEVVKKVEAATTTGPNAYLVEDEDGEGEYSADEDEYSVHDDEFLVDELPQEASQVTENESSTLKSDTVPPKPLAPKSWAALAKPSSVAAATTTADQPSIIADRNMLAAFGSMNVSEGGGQYSDAEDHDEPTSADAASAELQSNFPSLTAAATVPYEGSSDDEEEEAAHCKPIDHERREAKKLQALQPVSKSGRSYNSFRKYGNLMKPKSASNSAAKTKQEETIAPSNWEPRNNQETERLAN